MKINYNVYWAFFIGMSLCVLIPLLVLPNMAFGLNIVLSWTIMAYSGVKLSWLIIKNDRRLMELTFWIFVYIWIGLTSLIEIARETYPWGGMYPTQTISKSLLIFIVGFMFYELGMKISGRKLTVREEKTTTISSRRFRIMVLVSLLITYYATMKTGGIGSIFSTGLRGTGLSKMEDLVYSNLFHVPFFVCALVGLQRISISKLKFRSKLVVGLLLILTMLVNSPLITARYWFGAVMFTLLFTLFPWGKRGFMILSTGIIMILAFVFPNMDLYRSKGGREITANYFAVSGDFDAYQQLMNTVEYVNINGIVYGKQFVGAVFFWFPREYWSAKPYGSGQLVGEHLNYAFTNLSCPLWAEMYINFGWLGVILAFTLYGFYSGKLQAQYMYSIKGKVVSNSQLIVPFLAAYQIFLLRGDLLNGIAYMSCFFLFLWFVNFQMKRKKVPYTKPLLN